MRKAVRHCVLLTLIYSVDAIKTWLRQKSVLKLDKNFHIYVHVNNELIEKGYDEKKKMNYYKFYLGMKVSLEKL